MGRPTHQALFESGNLPIKHDGDVHDGKVRSVYWLTSEDSGRLIDQRGYRVPNDTPLGLMVISDRLSAFDVIWKGEGGLNGVPGKGAVLNAFTEHWFEGLETVSGAPHHILDKPHPLAWIVQRAEPIMVEGVMRAYITGSMWRAYARGDREFCGISLPDGLEKNQQLDRLLFTPTTKGVLNIPGIPTGDDAPISVEQILGQYAAFGFRTPEDVTAYRSLVNTGFTHIGALLAEQGQLFVDTKFELGYLKGSDGSSVLGYMDEAGTPDSSRIWSRSSYAGSQEHPTEHSKEGFRQFLLELQGVQGYGNAEVRDILLNKGRMEERRAFAAEYDVPLATMMRVSDTYRGILRHVTGRTFDLSENPRTELLDALNGDQYRLVS
jgi:phosphoribosylaminoimidazole-succinocarboxamide synthase